MIFYQTMSPDSLDHSMKARSKKGRIEIFNYIDLKQSIGNNVRIGKGCLTLFYQPHPNFVMILTGHRCISLEREGVKY